MLSRIQFSYQMSALERQKNKVDAAENARELQGHFVEISIVDSVFRPDEVVTGSTEESTVSSAAMHYNYKEEYLLIKHSSRSSGNK